ncbi:MAG: type VI secretion system ATPase TssH, partial [Spirochaetota bacterium]|nr:type VI secretion system ATPase TssH [Spirochaetota bacterium]
MNMNNYTTRSQEALSDAVSLAYDRNHQELGDVHLLKALVDQENGTIPTILIRLNVNLRDFGAELDGLLDKKPRVYGESASEPHIGRGLRNVLSGAEKIAGNMKDD